MRPQRTPRCPASSCSHTTPEQITSKLHFGADRLQGQIIFQICFVNSLSRTELHDVMVFPRARSAVCGLVTCYAEKRQVKPVSKSFPAL